MRQLTTEQQLVVEHANGPLLVRAPAGSGKTTTTLALIRRLIERGVPASSILMSTFSRSGTFDMRRKARELGVPAGVSYRTLHSVAFSMLLQARQHAVSARKRPPPEFTIISAENRWKLTIILKQELRRAARELGIAADGQGRYAGISQGDVAREISRAKAHIVAPTSWEKANGEVQPGYVAWAQAREREPLPVGLARLVGKVYLRSQAALDDPHGYDPRRFEAGSVWLPFDDMIFRVAQAIEMGSAWVQPWLGQYQWVLVDETQDNSPGQWVLVRHLSAARNLVAIGDDMQSIYGFRGAEPALMRHYLEDRTLSVRLVSLQHNFRSKQAIIDTANNILRVAPNRLDDTLMVSGRSDSSVGGRVTVSNYADPYEEADAVVDDAAALMDQGASPAEMAVLYRTNSQAGPLELACLKRGLSYRIAGSSFFRRPEVRTILSYLALAVDPLDQEAWKRAYCAPLRGLGKVFLGTHPTWGSAVAAYHNGSLRAGYRQGVGDLIGQMERVTQALQNGVDAAILAISEEVGVRSYYRDEDAGEDDITEVDAACSALAECAGALDDLDRLMEFARDQAGLRTEDPDGESAERPLLTLSTVHRAKGLEWDRVWVVGVNRGHFPHEMAPEDEERRLGYVAFTRAREELHVSYTDISIHGNDGGPSKLLAESGVISEHAMLWEEQSRMLDDAMYEGFL